MRLICCTALALLCASNAKPQAVTGLAAIRVASGLSSPLFAAAPPGDYNRLFIVQQGGRVLILNLATGVVNTTPFLDISAALQSGGEQGLLGLAFDPNYATNGKFYLNFTVPGGFWGNGTTHVSQFQVSGADPDVADSTSLATIGTANEKLLVSFDHPETNHNGGWIGFSPRSGDANNLYIATGDGGAGNDEGTGHIEPGGNAQNLTTVLGKMLRIHVDSAAGTASIPPNNPFVSTSGARGEIWAYGLRNPFRDSFDRLNGRMFIGDVGQNTREEVDVQQASNPGGGENYEWRLREGLIATPAGVGGNRPTGGVEPIVDYPHSGLSPPAITGQCVIGGYVYRGRQIPALQGTYVLGDYVAGKIFALNYDGTQASNFQDVTAKLFPTSVGNHNLANPSSFGEDTNGELYITDIGNGSVFKIVPVTPNVKIDSVSGQSGGPFVFKGTGVPFTNVTVQSTADLTQPFGSSVTVPVGGDGTFQFTDASPASPRFYRVVYP